MMTMNINIDEMISYACIAWVLAGKVNKVVLTPDLVEEYGPGLFGNKCAKCLEPEKLVLSSC